MSGFVFKIEACFVRFSRPVDGNDKIVVLRGVSYISDYIKCGWQTISKGKGRICMVLTDEEAEQFYDLWIPLLDFVNQKYRLIKRLYGMTSPEGLPLESVALISSKLWEDKEVIDEFLLSGFKKMDEREAAIVRSWKRAIHGKFIVDRHLRNGSVLISVDNNEVYIVKGIYSSWREMLEGYPMPQIIEATLIPFGNAIIHNGIVVPSGVCLGRNMSEQSKQIYLAAKKTGRLHYDL